MKIVCLGGGPAGLYFSILAKKANPSWDLTVVERNRAVAIERRHVHPVDEIPVLEAGAVDGRCRLQERLGSADVDLAENDAWHDARH